VFVFLVPQLQDDRKHESDSFILRAYLVQYVGLGSYAKKAKEITVHVNLSVLALGALTLDYPCLLPFR
jgi:hypothetical protein